MQADLIYYPFAERFAIAMPEFCKFDVRATHQIYGSWLDAMQGRKSAQISSANPDLLLKAFR